VITKPAATPKTACIGTAIAATRSVSFMADQAAGSTSHAKYTAIPFRNASVKTAASGTNRKIPRKRSASRIKKIRSQSGVEAG
jgi:hypothetical protein